MKTYLIHHTPKSATQDTWAVSFSLPYIAGEYARAGDGIWYVKTWLTPQQISKRLAILFDTPDELRVHQISPKEAALISRLQWLQGRLEDEEESGVLNAPRLMWGALQDAVQSFVLTRHMPASTNFMAANPGNSRAA